MIRIVEDVKDVNIYLGLRDKVGWIKLTKAQAQEALNKDIKRSSGKLNNQGFLAKAPAAVVEKEKAKLAEMEKQMKSLNERLEFLAKL